MSTVREECPICCQRTAIIKYMVTSPCCGGKACRDCYMTYLLGSHTHRCMYTADCDTIFTRKDIIDMFKKVDYDRLLNHAAELIVEIENQYIVKYHDLEAVKKMKDEVLFETNRLDHIIRPLQPAVTDITGLEKFLTRMPTSEELTDMMKRYEEQATVVKNVYKEYISMNKAFTAKYGGNFDSDDLDAVMKKKYMSVRCPVDDCNGYTDLSWRCIRCKSVVCKKCGELKKKVDIEDDEYTQSTLTVTEESDHKCIEENVLTFKEILLSSKPCPKCKAFIQKRSGCNDMWCTTCNTGFNWKTMTIIKRQFHNPHRQQYIKEMEAKGITVDEDHPEEEPNEQFIENASNKTLGPAVYTLYRNTRRYIHEANRQGNTVYDSMTNEKHRLRYINGYIDKKRFTSLCKTNMTKIHKAIDERLILLSLTKELKDLICQYAEGHLTAKETYEYGIEAIDKANSRYRELETKKVYTKMTRVTIDHYGLDINSIPNTYIETPLKTTKTSQNEDNTTDDGPVIVTINI